VLAPPDVRARFIAPTIPHGGGRASPELAIVKRVVEQFRGLDVLEAVAKDDPGPGAGEVGVTVSAAGVSGTDEPIRADAYLDGPKSPFAPGDEIIGVVEELGPAARGCGATND
jgi:NADPH:quinone reductase-like Zn-dependent oxidoreductase